MLPGLAAGAQVSKQTRGGTEDLNLNLTSGEATPCYFYWHHKGVQILPRWMHCVMPHTRIIVTFRTVTTNNSIHVLNM